VGFTAHFVGFNVLSEQIKEVVLFKQSEQVDDIIKKIFDPLLYFFGVPG
jgi:hypothetical protein